jgi:hypothetical protein
MNDFKSLRIPARPKYYLESRASDEDRASGSISMLPSKTSKRSLSSTSIDSFRQTRLAAANLNNQNSASVLAEQSAKLIHRSPSITEFIDNSKRVYTPHKLKCGVTVQVGGCVLEECPTVLEDLNHDLMECLSVLPASVRSLVRRTKIWLNRTYCYGPKVSFEQFECHQAREIFI